MPSLLNGFTLYVSPVQIVIIGRPGAPDTGALVKAACAASLPNRVLLQSAPGAALPDGHPAAGKTAVGDKATAFVCVNRACGLPITDGEDLSRQLAAL